MSRLGNRNPEEAALAGFPAAANARVLDVTIEGHVAQVEMRVGPEYPYFVCCERADGLWHERTSGNAWNDAWMDEEADDDDS